ncbi:Osteoclast-associated immunoglobulin-like receptor [Manis javanica]|nr:Osteoclast-associated immunoglobulin-like receptor [Manis javanica]
MAVVLALQLLTLWPLCCSDRTLTAPPASYRKPLLGAQPAEVVAPGVNVTLKCLAPQPAWKFVLFKSGEIPQVLEQNVSVELAEFFLEEVTPAQGGSYHCCYQRPGWELGVWSPPSNTVELLVTDELPQPGLEALPGAPLTLRCSGGPRGMSFALYLEGRATPLQYRRSAQPWADFALGARAAGTYSCYYHTPSAPYVLSPRSEPLAIRPDGSPDHTRGNLIRLGLAGLVLLSLAMLVVVDWRSQTGAPGRIQPRAPEGLQHETSPRNARPHTPPQRDRIVLPLYPHTLAQRS